MEDDLGGACTSHGRHDKFITNFIGKHELKRPCGRPRRR